MYVNGAETPSNKGLSEWMSPQIYFKCDALVS